MNFADHSLVLVKGDEIKTDDRPGLRPMIELAIKGIDLSETLLYDKVVGLASARLICICRPREVKTSVISSPAKRRLTEAGISFETGNEIANILNKDKIDICPMEAKALGAPDDRTFFEELKRIFRYS